MQKSPLNPDLDNPYLAFYDKGGANAQYSAVWMASRLWNFTMSKAKAVFRPLELQWFQGGDPTQGLAALICSPKIRGFEVNGDLVSQKRHSLRQELLQHPALRRLDLRCAGRSPSGWRPTDPRAGNPQRLLWPYIGPRPPSSPWSALRR